MIALALTLGLATPPAPADAQICWQFGDNISRWHVRTSQQGMETVYTLTDTKTFSNDPMVVEHGVSRIRLSEPRVTTNNGICAGLMTPDLEQCQTEHSRLENAPPRQINAYIIDGRTEAYEEVGGKLRAWKMGGNTGAWRTTDISGHGGMYTATFEADLTGTDAKATATATGTPAPYYNHKKTCDRLDVFATYTIGMTALWLAKQTYDAITEGIQRRSEEGRRNRRGSPFPKKKGRWEPVFEIQATQNRIGRAAIGMKLHDRYSLLYGVHGPEIRFTDPKRRFGLSLQHNEENDSQQLTFQLRW